MKKLLTGCVVVALVAFTGCNKSPTGGGAGRSSTTGSRASGTDTGKGATADTGKDTGKSGGIFGAKDTFKISAPVTSTTLKQGETKTATLKLNRESEFHEDVKLSFETPKGLKVEPNPVEVKASEKANDVEVRVTADKDAALGDHTIKVTGTPEKGKPTSVDFKITVKEGAKEEKKEEKK